MDEYVAEGRKFDYIISDLTDIPINVGHNGTLRLRVRECMCKHCAMRCSN